MTRNDLAATVMEDYLEGENEEWAKALVQIEAKLGMPLPSKFAAIAEAAFKAGLAAGTSWVARYIQAHPEYNEV